MKIRLLKKLRKYTYDYIKLDMTLSGRYAIKRSWKFDIMHPFNSIRKDPIYLTDYYDYMPMDLIITRKEINLHTEENLDKAIELLIQERSNMILNMIEDMRQRIKRAKINKDNKEALKKLKKL